VKYPNDLTRRRSVYRYRTFSKVRPRSLLEWLFLGGCVVGLYRLVIGSDRFQVMKLGLSEVSPSRLVSIVVLMFSNRGGRRYCPIRHCRSERDTLFIRYRPNTSRYWISPLPHLPACSARNEIYSSDIGFRPPKSYHHWYCGMSPSPCQDLIADD
jgi:hypothetical protein